MIASEVSTADITPAPSGAADVAYEGTSTQPTANGPWGPSINGKQLLVEGLEPEVVEDNVHYCCPNV